MHVKKFNNHCDVGTEEVLRTYFDFTIGQSGLD